MSPSSMSTEERNLFLACGSFRVNVVTMFVPGLVFPFISPGFLLLGIRQVRSSHLFFSFPGPPNFLLSRQNLHSPQSFIIQAEQLLHGILWVYFGIYTVVNSDCLFVIQY